MYFSITDRDEDSSYWTLKIPNVQGFFDLKFEGYFAHFKDRPKASYWEISPVGRSNEQEISCEEILKLFGNGCMTAGEELLESILSGPMENDFDDWTEWNGRADRDAAIESDLTAKHFQKATGF